MEPFVGPSYVPVRRVAHLSTPMDEVGIFVAGHEDLPLLLKDNSIEHVRFRQYFDAPGGTRSTTGDGAASNASRLSLCATGYATLAT